MEHSLQYLLACGLLLLAGSVAIVRRDPLSPSCVQPALWGVVLLVYLTVPHPFRPLSLETVLLVAAASSAFVLIGLSISPRVINTDPHQTRFEATALKPILFWLALLGLPAFALRAISIANSVDLTDSMFVNLRLALTGEDGDARTYGVLGYLLPVSFTSVFVELASSRRRGFGPSGWIALGVAICYALLATGRTTVFFLLIGLSFIALMQRRVSPLNLLWITMGLAGLAFFGIGVLLNKIGANSPNANALSAIDSISVYLLGGLAALDFSFHQSLAWELGANTFRAIMAVLKTIGLHVTVAPTLKEYVFVPEPSNVYTVFYPYVRDFGFLGAALFMSLLGAIHALLHNAAKRGDPRAIILSAISMYPLLMQFFDDQYFSLLSMWVSYAVLVSLCFRPKSPSSQN